MNVTFKILEVVGFWRLSEQNHIDSNRVFEGEFHYKQLLFIKLSIYLSGVSNSFHKLSAIYG